jgi:hypothetical protein
MTTPRVARREVLLDRNDTQFDPVIFHSYQPDDDPSSDTALLFSREDWFAMGKPEQVTVRILPGDRLNPDD